MNTIESKVLCRKCKNEVTPGEDDIVVCEKCFNMTSADQCKIEMKYLVLFKMSVKQDFRLQFNKIC